jgi:DNA polymerase elongation subunit (family B)
VQGPPLPLYGLDIETDTSCGGLDPRLGGIVAAAVSTPSRTDVLTGAERDVLVSLDRLLGGLAPGVVVTWHGAGFDLPFLADRAERAGIRLGLALQLDGSIDVRRPLPGHAGAYRAWWGAHTHLDAYQLFRDVGRAVLLSCSLKSMARFFGFEPVEVDRARIHDLADDDLSAYVASDATLARQLATLRWHAAGPFIDARHWRPAAQDAAARASAGGAPVGRATAARPNAALPV